MGHICRKIIDGLRDKSFGSVIEKCEKVTGATKVTQQSQDYGAQCTLSSLLHNGALLIIIVTL